MCGQRMQNSIIDVWDENKSFNYSLLLNNLKHKAGASH